MNVHFFVQKPPEKDSIDEDRSSDFEQFCCQMIRDAFEKRQKTLIVVDDYTQMAYWDALLWEEPTSFTPHDVHPSALPCPVLISLYSQPPETVFDKVINLSLHPISFHSPSVIECIRATDTAKKSGRDKFRQYQSQSAQLATDFF